MEDFEETFGYVRPERVNRCSNSMKDMLIYMIGKVITREHFEYCVHSQIFNISVGI